MSAAIIEAINKMDPDNDAHWTVDGLAKLDTVKFLLGAPVTREELEAAAPGFNRESFRAYRASQGVVNAPTVAVATGTGSGGGVGSTAPAPSPAPAPIQPAPEPGPSSRETQVQTLAATIDRENKTIVELQRVQEQARKDIVLAQGRMDAAQIELNKLSPPETNQETIQRYLQRQVEIGQEKADLRARVKASGVDLKEVAKAIAGSPLDEAMKQRNRRSG